MFYSRAIRDSRKVKDMLEVVKEQDKPKRIPSWKRHLIEKKKRNAAKVCLFGRFTIVVCSALPPDSNS